MPGAEHHNKLSVMKKLGRYRVPSTSTLIAFEATARLGSVTFAARELGTTQSVVSRYVTKLERELSVRLFRRSRAGMSLTKAGRHFHDAVVAGLGAIHTGREEVVELPHTPQVRIACSHDVSHLLMMPRHDALQVVVGEDIQIRFLTYLRHIDELAPVEAADIVVSWCVSDAVTEDHVLLVPEEVQPICSPEYAAANAELLRAPAAGWGALTLLDVRKPNLGWATWRDWFDVVGHPDAPPRVEDFDNYTLTLQAAVAGRGVALGWRYCIEWYLDSGALVTIGDAYYPFPDGCFASLTDRGRRNPGARKCLAFFENFPEPRMSRGKFDSRDRSRHVKLPSWPSQETVKHRSRS